jgi:hypothetical protein
MILFYFASAWAQEYRGGVSADIGITSRLDAEAEVELRRIFYPEYYLNRTFQGGISYNLSRTLNASLSYTFSLIDKDKDFPDPEEEDETSEKRKISFDLQFQPRRFTNDLRISNRFRYQHTILENEDEPHQYLRNKITLDYKISGKMNPYIAVEPYFQLSENELSVIRFYLGNEVGFIGTKIDLYYIAEIRQGEESPIAQYIIGVTLKLDFWKK